MAEKLKGGKHWVLLSDQPEPEPEPERTLPPGDQRIRLSVEKRPFGKVATVISGLVLTAEELKTLSRGLKSACGRGGSVGGATVELQGDCRARAREWLESRGWGLA
jgi:translation initiation factor 1